MRPQGTHLQDVGQRQQRPPSVGVLAADQVARIEVQGRTSCFDDATVAARVSRDGLEDGRERIGRHAAR